nr:buforin II [Cloning vector pRJK055]AKQ98641.1 buforin II [Cloning vector pRJK055]
MTRSSRAGLQFPVGRVHRLLRKDYKDDDDK